MKLIILLAVFAALVSVARGKSSPELRDELRKFAAAVQQSLDKKLDPGDKPHPATPVETILARLNFADDDFGPAEEMLTMMRPYLETDELRQQCDVLIARFRADRDVSQKSTAAQIEGAVQRAITAIRGAKRPDDLDAVVAELSRFKDDQPFLRGDNGREGFMLQTRAARAQSFTEKWQSYLAAVQANDGAEASQILERLVQEGWPEAMPRSQLLALQWKRSQPVSAEPTPAQTPSPAEATPTPTPVPSLKEIVQAIKSPGDLEAATAALGKLSPSDFSSFGTEKYSDVQAALKATVELNAAYLAFKAGLAAEVGIARPTLEREHAILNNLMAVRSQLLALVLPRYLQLPEGTRAKRDEGPIAYLERMSQEARDRKDYLLLSRAQDALAIIRNDRNRAYDGTSPASLFLIAANQEAGGQYALAVTNYEKALGSSNPLVLPQVIGERLTALKAAHPEEYQQGVDNYISPPQPRYEGSMGRRAGYPFPDRPTLTKPAALSVPPVAAAPTPAPAKP